MYIIVNTLHKIDNKDNDDDDDNNNNNNSNFIKLLSITRGLTNAPTTLQQN